MLHNPDGRAKGQARFSTHLACDGVRRRLTQPQRGSRGHTNAGGACLACPGAWDSLRPVITRPRLIVEVASSIGAGLCALKSKAARERNRRPSDGKARCCIGRRDPVCFRSVENE